MNEDQHIIKFKYNMDLYFNFLKKDIIIIDDDYYKSFEDEECPIYIRIYYNNLNIYNSIFSNNRFDYIFNLSNILYKLHTKDYYSKTYQNKGLI